MLNKTFNAAAASLATAVISACTAHAQPPKFPDLDTFQPVDPAPFTAAARAGGGAYFVTPDGLQCSVPHPYQPDDHVSASCAGPLPGLPDSAPRGKAGCSAVGSPTSLPTDLGPYSFQEGTGCPVLTTPLLDVGQKITTAGITCAVGADRLTACIDPVLNRGFVLQPSGSWTF